MNALSLPSISNARLPKAYEAAQTALAECQSVDECKDWADKAAALASYAKQSQDETLMKMAARIRARAIRRAGELAKQIMQPQGRPEKDTATDTFSKAEIQESSGFSKRQLDTALRIAAVPEQVFEEQVESPKPPTLSQLAQQGIRPRPSDHLKGRDPKQFNRALHFLAEFERYARTLKKVDLPSALADLNDDERQELRIHINAIDAIHDQIITRI